MLGRDTAQRLLDALSESGSDQHTEPFVDLLHRELDPEVVRYLVPQESYSFTKATDTVSLGVGLAMDGAELSTDLTAYLDEMVAVRNTA
ncbi:hypothetical protein C1J03_05340 [Sulfitobacter sp. SK012]|nr:hypothetical protein C1J03_05340 [Sulfitobacter sp. SK012]